MHKNMWYTIYGTFLGLICHFIVPEIGYICSTHLIYAAVNMSIVAKTKRVDSVSNFFFLGLLKMIATPLNFQLQVSCEFRGSKVYFCGPWDS